MLKRSPEWFSLFDGPKNRAELANYLGRGAEHKLFYGDWSTLSHATDLNRFLSTLNGKPAFDAVRRPNELQSISQLAALLLLRATREMIDRFRRGEKLDAWYSSDVEPLLGQLMNLTVSFTPLT